MARKKAVQKRRKPLVRNRAPKQKNPYVMPMVPGANESWSSNV